jgi:hypothetical protein
MAPTKLIGGVQIVPGRVRIPLLGGATVPSGLQIRNPVSFF